MERGWRLEGVENTGKEPLPKSSWRESGKLETAAGTKLKREKGDGLNSIVTVTRGAQRLQLCSSIPGSVLVGRANPQEQSGVWEVLRPHAERSFHCWKGIWWRLLGPPGTSRPQKLATFTGAGTRSLRVKPGAGCVCDFP